MNEFSERFVSRQYGLVLPKRDNEQIERYVAQMGRDVSVERVPFRRQVDFWAFSIATALAMKLDPVDGPPSRWGKVFIYTPQGVLDDDLCALLAVVAIDKMGIDNPDVANPGRIVDLANRLAGAGCPVVLDNLSETSLRTTPLDRAVAFARTLRAADQPPECSEDSR